MSELPPRSYAIGSPQIRQWLRRLALRLPHFAQRLYILRAKSCVTMALKPRIHTRSARLRSVSFKV